MYIITDHWLVQWHDLCSNNPSPLPLNNGRSHAFTADAKDKANSSRFHRNPFLGGLIWFHDIDQLLYLAQKHIKFVVHMDRSKQKPACCITWYGRKNLRKSHKNNSSLIVLDESLIFDVKNTVKKTQQSYCQIHDFGFGFNAQNSAENYMKRYSRQRERERERWWCPWNYSGRRLFQKHYFPQAKGLRWNLKRNEIVSGGNPD